MAFLAIFVAFLSGTLLALALWWVHGHNAAYAALDAGLGVLLACLALALAVLTYAERR